MRLTQRGRRVIVGTALLAGFGAGMTAQLWDPYTRSLDAVTVHITDPVEEDQAGCAGAVEVAFDRNQDGSADIVCGVGR